MRIHKLSSIIGLVALSASLSAQAASNCPNGPGSAFGIVAYQCANCGFKQESGQRPSYTFFAEPVVTQVDRPAADLVARVGAAIASTRPVYVVDGVIVFDAAAQGSAAVGDVIEAVDGRPITTQAGADLFAYPTSGSHSLTVRRGRERQSLEVSVPASCDTRTLRIRGTSRLGTFASRADSLRYVGDTVYIRGDSVYRGSGGAAAVATSVSGTLDGVRRGSGSGSGSGGGAASASTARGGSGGSGGRGYGRGVPVIGGDPVEVNGSGVTTTAGATPAVGKFGFAVECKPSCTMKQRPNGEYYFKYDGYPRIIEVRDRSAADRAGLRVGDVITRIEGRSILADDALTDTEHRDQLHMTIRRDGKDIEVVMVVVR
ncbi:MAG TPA: PDZ domain-containing protein [Gemmatimonadaceae bacterium]|jgi:hypothetical protein|nr:PDZ domain-containing protein [Gemmatimonadaceae bacterium]